MSCRTRRSLAALLVGMAAVLSFSPQSAHAANGTSLTVVHGVRGLVADVYLDGKVALRSFEPMRITDPLPVPPGPRRVAIRESGASKTAEPLVAGTVRLPAGTDSAAVAHLDENGDPALSLFPDDADPVGAGQARVVVRHAAAAAAVDVRLGDRVVARGLTNGDQQTSIVSASMHPITARPAGGSQLLLPAEDTPVRAGVVTALYLIGSADDGDLAWLAQQVKVRQPMPTDVVAGDGPAPRPTPTAVVAGMVAALAVGLLMIRRRAR